MPDKPLVSIIIANYNYGRFLKEAIESCLKQDHSPVEVIVVDDGSTDNSREIIASFGDKIIPLLKDNGGQASAFNAGFKQSKGEYICLMDADDIFMPQKVSKTVEAFRKYSEADWCFHAVQTIGDYHWQAEATTSWMKKSKKEDWLVDLSKSDSFRKIHAKMPFIPPTSANCYTSELLAKLLPLPEDPSMTFNDFYLHLAAFHLAKGVLIKEPLTYYRIHGQNDSLRTTLKRRGRNYILLSYRLHKKFSGNKKLWDNLLMKGISLALASFSLKNNDRELFKKYRQEFKLSLGPIFWLKLGINIVRSYLYGTYDIWKNILLKK